MELQLASYCVQSGQLLRTAGAAVCLHGGTVAQLFNRKGYSTSCTPSPADADFVHDTERTCPTKNAPASYHGPLTASSLRARLLPAGHHAFSTRSRTDTLDNDTTQSDNLQAVKRHSKLTMSYTLTQAMEQSYCPSVIHLPAIPSSTPILMSEGDAIYAAAKQKSSSSPPTSPSRFISSSRPPSPTTDFGNIRRLMATVTRSNGAAATASQEHAVQAPTTGQVDLHVAPHSSQELVLWFTHGKGQPRLKGISRKLLLRQVNRRIVTRLARRATIAIPVLGFYFVSKLLVKDFQRVRAEYKQGHNLVAGLFATAFCMDILDLAAQATIITGLAHGNFGVGVAAAAAFLAAADKASLATAAISCLSGISGELVSAAQTEQEMEHAWAASVQEHADEGQAHDEQVHAFEEVQNKEKME